jgi:hypothetical protein
LADLDAVTVGIGDPGRAHDARHRLDRAELDPGRGGRGEPLVEVVDLPARSASRSTYSQPPPVSCQAASSSLGSIVGGAPSRRL